MDKNDLILNIYYVLLTNKKSFDEKYLKELLEKLEAKSSKS